jgi:STE24 endopeptidase
MTSARAAVLIAALALASAVALALASRAPAAVRTERTAPGATDAARGASFTDAEIARHGRYRAPSYLSYALHVVLGAAVLVVLARGPMRGFVDRIEGWPGGWVTRAIVCSIAVLVVTTLASLPLAYVRGFAMEHAWGLSTQDTGSWLSDVLRSLLVGAVTSAVAAVAFYGLVRWQPRAWWIWGWGAFTLLTALFVFVWPVLVAPLFNKFTPLEDAALAQRITSIAADAGIELDEVLVADASRRTTAENAYVAGLGGTKRMVLYDTLLAAGDERATLFVVAHELGHARESHVVKNVALSSVGLFVGFAALALLARHEPVWAWAGASGIGDVRALPVLLLFLAAAELAVLPAANGVSRAFEAHADRIAVALTDDPDAAVRSFRRLAYSNIADLRPPAPLVWALFSHPPTPDRIRAVAGIDPAP